MFHFLYSFLGFRWIAFRNFEGNTKISNVH